MLQLNSISLQFGDRKLFDNINLLVNPGERVGLTGPNGSGKTTLLKIIAGEEQPEEGDVVLGGGSTVGYLPQDGVEPDPALTVFEEVESCFEELVQLRRELHEVQRAMEENETGSKPHQKALSRFGVIQEKLEQSGSFSLHAEIEKILSGLGFEETDFNRSTSHFSGGWLMRIALAKLLLKKPTYLLLDEPTNHLDIESMQWMEKFLHNYEGAVIVVSHDKSFLDEITRRTLALNAGNLYDYAGNYSFYEQKFEEHKKQLEKEFENRQKEIKQAERFIDRFRYKASKAKQVQSRIKQLEKLEKIETIGEEDEITFRFPQPQRSGEIIMRVNNLEKSFGELTVFDGVDYEIERGDKVAVVGPNGAGKSTLIKILAGVEPVSSGRREPGHNVTISFFAQHQAEELDPDLDLLDEMRKAAPLESETRIRTLLGCFLFEGDDVFKKVRVLSGGEKSRLALAKMLVKPANLLIFDEPTNHLDMKSKKILKEALLQFEGTCMIVSHDREFLDSIVNKTLEVQPGSIRTWHCNVSEYLDLREKNGTAQMRDVGEREKTYELGEDSVKTISRKEERRIRAEMRVEKSNRLKPYQKQLKTVESEIQRLESRKSEIEDQMKNPSFYDDGEKVKEVTIEYDKIQSELEQTYIKWEEIAGRIESIEESFEVL